MIFRFKRIFSWRVREPAAAIGVELLDLIGRLNPVVSYFTL